MRSTLHPSFALPVDNTIRLISATAVDILGEDYVITNPGICTEDKRMLLLRPAHGAAVAVRVVYHPIPNLITPAVAEALCLFERSPLIAWFVEPGLPPGRTLSLDGYALDCGACAVKLPPQGMIYYSTENSEKRQQLKRKLSPIHFFQASVE